MRATAGGADIQAFTSAWSAARRLHRLLPRRLRRGWMLLVVVAGLCSLAELATTAVLLGVMRLATQPPGTGFRLPLPWAEPPLLVAGARAALLAAAVVTSVFLLRAALALALTAVTSSSTVETGIFIGEALFAHYVRMPYARFRQRGVAELQRRVTHLANDVVGQVFRPGVQLVTDAAVIASVLSIMVIASPWGTLAAAALVLAVSLLLIRAVNPRVYRTSLRMDRHDRSAYVFVEQVLHGRREITLRGHETQVVASYLEERHAVGDATRQRAILLELPRIVIEGATMIIVTGLVIFAVGLGLDTPRVVATLGLFAYALLRLMPLATRLTANLGTFRAGLPSLDVVLQDLGPALEGTRCLVRRPAASTSADGEVGRPIEFRDVSSCYEGAREPAVRNVTVRVEAGTFVGVVGPSGAGKSTFVDLLLGLLTPTAGEVLVDGRPRRDVGDGWPARVGVVSQEPYIFNDSVLRNVVLFADTIDERRVAQVLDDVGLWDLIQRLPKGLHTHVGERGSALSGGQRQRLAVARALYADPGLLVLDEATSALDPDGEAVVMRAALRRARPRTVIAVTHRASAIADCDQVIVLEDGLVTAAGSYDDVLAKSAYFARLVGLAVPGPPR